MNPLDVVLILAFALVVAGVFLLAGLGAALLVAGLVLGLGALTAGRRAPRGTGGPA